MIYLSLGKPKLEEKIYYYLGFLRPIQWTCHTCHSGPRDAGVTTSLERVLDALTAQQVRVPDYSYQLYKSTARSHMLAEQYYPTVHGCLPDPRHDLEKPIAVRGTGTRNCGAG